MRPWQKEMRGQMKAHEYMGRTSHLIKSGSTEKIRTIVLLPGIMQKTVLKKEIATLARSEAKSEIQLRSQTYSPSLST